MHEIGGRRERKIHEGEIEEDHCCRSKAYSKAAERDEAIAEAEELEQRAQHLAEEKESLYLDENFIPDEEPITDSAEIYPDEDLNGAASLLDEGLIISEEVDLIEEDY